MTSFFPIAAFIADVQMEAALQDVTVHEPIR